MSFSRLLFQLAHDPRFCMEERRFKAQYSVVMNNMQLGIHAEFDPKTLVQIVPMGAAAIDCTDRAELQSALQGDSLKGADQSFINVVNIQGTMTREGDACTYGSKEHLEMIKEAADDPRCHGHIHYINSGGGQASTLIDYREAINYCLAKGQNVVAVVDECAASAACFDANMTNRIFVTRDTDELGSLGMFAVFTTIADGTVIPQTNEVVHIRYAKQSTDKNLAFREAAEGNLKPIDDMLEHDLAEVLANTKKDRECLLPEQLTGKMYRAKDVMGSMVDEIGDISAAISWLENDWQSRGGAPLELKLEADHTEPEPQNDPEPEPQQDPQNDPEPEPEPQNNSQDPDGNNSSLLTPNSSLPMYENIASALNVEQIEHTEDGVMLNTPLADALEQHLGAHAETIAARDQQIADLQAQVASFQAAQAEAEQAHASAIEALNAEHAAAIEAAVAQATEALNAEHTAAVEALNAEHSAAVEALNAEHQQTVDGLNATIDQNAQQIADTAEQLAAANQRVSDLSAEVETLNNAHGQQPQAGQQPVSNGKTEAGQTVATAYTYNPALSAKENADLRRKALGK